MNSEKVKEIKKALECWQESVMLSTDENYVSHKVYNREILDYINELESENERLNKELKRYKLDWLNSEKMHLQADMEDTEFELFCANKSLGEVRTENKQLQDRIAELEKENKDYYDELNNLQSYIDNHEEIWKGNTNNALKQFAEMLIEKKIKLGDRFNIYDIDETLKEFINE